VLERNQQNHLAADGVGQLTLVEHALCPLDSRISLVPNLLHETAFDFTDKNRRRRSGKVKVYCPRGLSAQDEFYLWGLLALTLSDPDTDGELHATRHYCLRQLGVIDTNSRRGGRQYERFRSAIERLSCVQYENDSFYDPIRAEHRRVSFGFFSYSMPRDAASSRAWRVVWDPIFFEFAQAARGSLRFDLAIYRSLDVASRRLYLFVSKIFSRRQMTPRVDLADIAVHLLGFSPSLDRRHMLAKVNRCIETLGQLGIVEADGGSPVQRIGDGRYVVMLRRGTGYAKRWQNTRHVESPLMEPLLELGFEKAEVDGVLKRFPSRVVREWVDITLAARERFGRKFFRRNPAAYLMDNLKHAAAGKRTPPDWWREIRRAEDRRDAERRQNQADPARRIVPLPEKAIEAIDTVHEALLKQFMAAGQPRATARQNAQRFRAEQVRRQGSKTGSFS
jgi:hypothetical protein